jgi:hypothetical protein
VHSRGSPCALRLPAPPRPCTRVRQPVPRPERRRRRARPLDRSRARPRGPGVLEARPAPGDPACLVAERPSRSWVAEAACSHEPSRRSRDFLTAVNGSSWVGLRCSYGWVRSHGPLLTLTRWLVRRRAWSRSCRRDAGLVVVGGELQIAVDGGVVEVDVMDLADNPLPRDIERRAFALARRLALLRQRPSIHTRSSAKQRSIRRRASTERRGHRGNDHPGRRDQRGPVG